MLCTATDVGIYGLLASQSCYHSMLAPCWFTLWTSSRFLYPYTLLISLEIFLFSLIIWQAQNGDPIACRSSKTPDRYVFSVIHTAQRYSIKLVLGHVR